MVGGMSKLTPHEEREIAVAAGVDPRTVRSYLAGAPTSSTTKARIDRVLAERTTGTLRGDINGSVPTTKREA